MTEIKHIVDADSMAGVIPHVVVVGRPNVGKSSIFNWLAKHRISIVEPTAGVTRDRVTYLMQEKNRYFEMIDTGGIGIVDRDDLSADIDRQIETAMLQADLIVFVVDGSTGMNPLDREVADRIRKIERPKLLVVNKCDSTKCDLDAGEFLRLIDLPMVITSIPGNRNRQQLLDAIIALLPEEQQGEKTAGEVASAKPELKLALVGRRNVGKSTLLNALAQTERMIVSEVAGTTRDSVDVRFELDGKSFVAIDTPGVRKQKSLANDIEYYGLTRAHRSIRRADVVLMMLDATQTVSQVDKHLISDIEEAVKPCIFVINKWDLAKEADMEIAAWGQYLARSFPSLSHIPIAGITAKNGRNVKKLINLSQSVYKQSRRRVSTGRFNRALKKAIEKSPPPAKNRKRPKIFYGSQIGIEPPTFVFKCNDARLIDDTWKRYLISTLREELGFHEIPVKVYWRSKGESFDPQISPIEDVQFESIDDGLPN